MPAHDFRPPGDWLCIQSVDVHAAGEPLRVITGGWPPVPGETILARRRYAVENQDALRRALMWEPRGHADMYGCLVLPPATEDGDVGVLFMHNEGWSTMCGHGIIGVMKAGVETGLLEGRSEGGDRVEVNVDTPAGRVVATAHLASAGYLVPGVGGGRRVERVTFLNVPSFTQALDLRVNVPGVGDPVRFDLAFGGAFYAYVDADSLGLKLLPEHADRIAELGIRIKRAVSEAVRPSHPDADPDLEFLYGTIFTGPGLSGGDLREVCVFADGEVDRSPTGTGVSGLSAILRARWELATDRAIEVESLIGTRFTVRIVDEFEVAGRACVLPEVGGTAYITGRHEFWIDPLDPLREGFLLGRGDHR
ncbi:MAG: proline racemase family protein [marine benthic group bacterium]|nr:proline racemase family protein [Gemmatimonadota bacterium]